MVNLGSLFFLFLPKMKMFNQPSQRGRGNTFNYISIKFEVCSLFVFGGAGVLISSSSRSFVFFHCFFPFTMGIKHSPK